MSVMYLVPRTLNVQDVSRTFLGGGGNSDKTKFAIYMKATQLETVQTQLYHSNQDVEESKARMDKAEESLNAHRVELQELEKVVETMRETESMQVGCAPEDSSIAPFTSRQRPRNIACVVLDIC